MIWLPEELWASVAVSIAVLEAAAAADSSEDVDDHHLLYLLGEVAWGFESAAPPELLPIGVDGAVGVERRKVCSGGGDGVAEAHQAQHVIHRTSS
ncbi:hypothetical protein HaLaN_15637 [Haematococcus lacustris]|uniref:Secreted protein n=1 Tax=Haematococcus lacustris TaxID=44745 RepID=A0A699ZBJ8_HAELA|nr:hypothetical protein HaLaN_15637 [Haematococcus lacustris]